MGWNVSSEKMEPLSTPDPPPETLLNWVQRNEIDRGTRDGVTSAEHERLSALKREVKELRRANEIPKLATVFFA